jgi:hypothetical protein
VNRWPRPLCSVHVRVTVAWPARGPRRGIT